MSRTVSTRAVAIGAGLLLLSSVGATLALNSSAASGAVVRHTHLVAPRVVGNAVAAATQMYISFTGIAGGGSQKAYNFASAALQVSLNTSKNPSTRLNLSDLSVTKPLDAATPDILNAEANGTVIPTVNVFVQGLTSAGTPKSFTRYELTNVLVSSDTVTSAVPNEIERLTLTFQQIKITRSYGPQTPRIFYYNLAPA